MTVEQQMTAADEFATLWRILLAAFPVPEHQQFLLWAGIYTGELVSRAINRAAAKVRKMRDSGTPMDADAAIRYATSVMKNELLGQKAFGRRDS